MNYLFDHTYNILYSGVSRGIAINKPWIEVHHYDTIVLFLKMRLELYFIVSPSFHTKKTVKNYLQPCGEHRQVRYDNWDKD